MKSNKQVLDELRAQGYRVGVQHGRHYWHGDAGWRDYGGLPAACGGLTQVSIWQGEDSIALGEARCNKKDHYVKKIGLAIALGRAVKQLKGKTSCRASTPE